MKYDCLLYEGRIQIGWIEIKVLCPSSTIRQEVREQGKKVYNMNFTICTLQLILLQCLSWASLHWSHVKERKGTSWSRKFSFILQFRFKTYIHGKWIRCLKRASPLFHKQESSQSLPSNPISQKWKLKLTLTIKTVNVIFAFALQNGSSNQNFLQQWKQELLKYSVSWSQYTHTRKILLH